MPEEGIELVPRAGDPQLRGDPRRRAGRGVAWACARVRLTGGEPLVRKGIVDLVAHDQRASPGIEDISLTTNGIVLAAYAEDAGAGRPRARQRQPGHPAAGALPRDHPRRPLEDVLEGIAAARAAGLSPIKLNVVVMRGVNDDEVVDFARSTLRARTGRSASSS